tara:strand:+ start:119 stop:997 length:879 start_codon:yes stop_codon:yes gene_type:complete
MLESGPENTKAFHLAGIIPVAGPKLDFGFPWHDSMQPIAKNYLLVERAVVECANAGCETIWIVCNDDMQPLIKHRMGDYIEDPYSLGKSNFVKFPSEHRRQIPIFYCPIHPKDRDRRDSLGWSALHGALNAFIISNKISKWLVPSRYYVAFPYGIYPPESVFEHRKKISHKDPFFLSFEGRTVKDGEYLGFTMSGEEYKAYVRSIKESCTSGDKSLPPAERWSSRHFGLDKIFECGKIEESKKHELPWYYRADTWESLKEFWASPSSGKLKRPSASMFKRSNYNKIGAPVEQ